MLSLTMSADEKTLCQQVARQFPQFTDLLDKLRQADLEAMSLTTPDHFCTYKGRVQMLTQLRQQIRA